MFAVIVTPENCGTGSKNKKKPKRSKKKEKRNKIRLALHKRATYQKKKFIAVSSDVDSPLTQKKKTKKKQK